jgi:polyisoprenoid-binding protein YceI
MVKLNHAVAPQFGYGETVMSIPAGSYTLGPENAELLVKTGRTGAAAKAGHDLVIEVTQWGASLELAPDPAQTTAQLHADGGSLRVREGKGGMQSLGEDDKRGISQTIDEEVLKRSAIDFRSTGAAASDDETRITVQGELELHGKRAPASFELTMADGALNARARIKQSDWGMKPYSTLFGTLKVVDEVEITLTAKLGNG